MLSMDDYVAGEDSADQAAPEHETGPAEHRARVAHQDRVVELATEESADDSGEDDVTDGLGIVAAARELPLGNDLTDYKRHQNGETKACELQWADIVGER